MADDQETSSQGAQPEDSPDDMARAVRELTEALTAFGNFVAAAVQISNGGNAIGADIRAPLERALSPHERAWVALQWFQQLVTSRKQS